ncbi:MAG: histidine kinase [Cyclobacteriaceae bacterium]
MKKLSLLALTYSGVGVCFFIYLYYSEFGAFPLSIVQLPNLLISVVLANLVGSLTFVIDSQLNKIIDWKRSFFSRFSIGFVVNCLAASLLLIAIGFLAAKTFIGGTTLSVYQQYHEEVWKLGILAVITLFIYEVFYGWFYSYRYFATAQIESLRQDRLQMELQFDSLKSQISPHYLFNCLNTISSLMYKDKDMAEEFIRRMADTFRYVIDNQKKKLVSVAEEIQFVKAYYYLLQVRYQQDLKIEINLPNSLLTTSVPPLAIQMLIENAIKHNEISKKQPLFIYISALDNTYINVSSTKTLSKQSVESFHVGLQNIKSRYRFFVAKEIKIKDNEKYVVQLPVISHPPDFLRLESKVAIHE